MTEKTTTAPEEKGSGLGYALGAYLAWGIMPVYFKLLANVGALEIVAWRIVVGAPFCLAILAYRGTLAELIDIARHRKWLLALLTSSVLIGGNWLLFIHAVNDGHVLATSLGYYLNPLITVLLGRMVLRESLSAMSKIALVLAGCGVALLASGALDTLWISLALAISFALYGLVRKLTPVGSVAGLAVETLMLSPIALGALVHLSSQPGGLAMTVGGQTTLLLLAAGIVTAIPLVFFATAARRLSLTTLGFMQYIAPTMTFLLGLFVYGEPFSLITLGSFLFIWSGIALVTGEAWMKRRRSQQDRARAQAYRIQ